MFLFIWKIIIFIDFIFSRYFEKLEKYHKQWKIYIKDGYKYNKGYHKCENKEIDKLRLVVCKVRSRAMDCFGWMADGATV